MPVLRLTQSAEAGGTHRVEVALEGDNIARQTATSRFEFALKPEDAARLRWYFEDFLQYPHDPAPRIASLVEQRMRELGIELFGKVFQTTERGRRLWARLEETLDETRVEVAAEVREAAAIPWELIRDPLTDVPLAYRASAFVRAHPEAVRHSRLLSQTPERVRILLVICRPGGGDDVPFRSVASRLVKGLSGVRQELVDLDVLRPPTFDQLGRVLRAARKAGRPYHLVHFDGHGVYTTSRRVSAPESIEQGVSAGVFSRSSSSAHGYLLFEHPALEGNAEMVDGTALGKLLAETRVPVLVLNACRSAHAEAPPEPEAAEVDAESPARAFGSLAQQVMDAGVAGVVAMRYNVYVVTAAQFVAELYARLARGDQLGEAVSLGRKQLHDQPLREIGYQPIPLQDWVVPIVYEATPIALFPRVVERRELTITLHAGDTASATQALDPNLPQPPDAGFYGRDETLLALDRAFDTQHVVLLHAYAGSGKTATAAEFARWYALTGGIDGPVLFTSFEQYTPLARVLDQIGRLFGDAFEQQGVHWLTLTDAHRKDVALQVLSQVPVLWLWDNVEQVGGFPEGTPTAWSAADQRELAEFLRAGRETRAKFLLTSRRDERGWLGGLPARTTVPPMPMQERVQLARAIAEKHGNRVTDVEDWRPLLRFTEGNPLTITVLVGQALRDGLRTKEQIEAFVARLRAGEAAVEDEGTEGRSQSLGASLSYGFEHTFTDAERQQLALLYFFQGFVNVDVLRVMGDPDRDWCVPAVRGLTREAGIALLDRAAEIGLLTAHGGGSYSIHPALPWYFSSLFQQHYGAAAPGSTGAAGSEAPQRRATRAFIEAEERLARHYVMQSSGGDRSVLANLAAEEANLLYVCHVARVHEWWIAVVNAMHGLLQLYQHTGRRAEWRRLVEDVVPDIVDLTTDRPLAGRHESTWSIVTGYRVGLAREALDWEEAERLQRMLLESSRLLAATMLAMPANALEDAQRNTIRTLGAAVHELGNIQSERGQAECVAAYEEALTLAERIGDHVGAATCAGDLGITHITMLPLRDLDKAEHWMRRALELTPKNDRIAISRYTRGLGAVALERFDDAQRSGASEKELLNHINTARKRCEESLELSPNSDVTGRSVIHAQLGEIYARVGDLDRALPHYQEAVHYEEQKANVYGAAKIRFNVSAELWRAKRFADALEYARAALRSFETFGARAAKDIERTRTLIADIERAQPQGA